MRRCVTLCMIILVLPVHADEHYVAPSGSHEFPFISWAAASTDIQNAVDASMDGDLVLVSNGVYFLSQQIVVTNGITLRGVGGASRTVIDGQSMCRCLYVSNLNAAIEGFTFQHGQYHDGAGIMCEGGAMVMGCNVVNNFAIWGAGVHCVRGGTISDCIVSFNRSTDWGNGGGLRCLAPATIRNCLIYGNSTSNNGGGLECWGEVVVENCTIAMNSASNGGGVYCLDSGTRILNTIIYDNIAGVCSNYCMAPNVFYTNCCVAPLPTNGSNNTSLDPLFSNINRGDCRLKPQSPCIDAGSNQLWMMGACDLAAVSRIIHSNADIGCYEYWGFPALPTLQNTQILCRWNVLPGERYQFERLDNLMKSEWDPISGIVTSSSESIQVLDTNNTATAFYRMQYMIH